MANAESFIYEPLLCDGRVIGEQINVMELCKISLSEVEFFL